MKRLSRLLCSLGALFTCGGLSHALTTPASEDTTVADKRTTLAASHTGNLAVDPTGVALVYLNLDESARPSPKPRNTARAGLGNGAKCNLHHLVSKPFGSSL